MATDMDAIRDQAAKQAGNEEYCQACESDQWNLFPHYKICRHCGRQVQIGRLPRNDLSTSTAQSSQAPLLF